MAAISVVIPTLDEAAQLPRTLAALHRHRSRSLPRPEVVVADGGSADATVKIARHWQARVVEGARGRGAQLNLGAAASRGEILVFLHADTLLPPGWDLAVAATLRRSGVAGGAFSFALDSPTAFLKLVQWGVNVRHKLANLPYGDQALFCRREVFENLGGFSEAPLMEDVALVRELKQQGRLVRLNKAVVTSARRWRQRGPLATTALNLHLLLCYLLGVPPAKLAKMRYGRGASR